MQTSCRIDEHHISIVGNGGTDGIVGNGCRIATHLLFHDRHTYTFAPYTQLLNGSSTEGVGSAKIDFLACLLELIGQLTNRGRLTHTIHTNHQNHVWLMVRRQLESLSIFCVVLRQEIRNLFAQNAIEFGGIYIFVTSHSSLDFLDNLQSCIYAHIRGDQHLLQIVQHLVVHLRLPCYCTGNLSEHTLFGLRQSVVQRFLLFLSKYIIKESHI